MVVYSILMNHLVKVNLVPSAPFLLLLLDLRVAANSLVLHAICADADSALVLQLDWNLLVLRLDALATISVSYSSD